jgi:putative membrane protein
LRHMKKVMIAGTMVLSMAAATAFAAQGGQASKARSSGSADVDFIMDAAKGGMAEVELGQLAADKAASDDVKKFGQRMVSDHTKANDELKSLAQSKSITLPTEVDAKDKATHDRLAKLSGAAFDRAYMQHMLADHRKDVNEFKKESTSGKDSDVKAWASKTLPTLEEHLKMAQDTNKAVGTSGTTSGSKKAKGTSGR